MADDYSKLADLVVSEFYDSTGESPDICYLHDITKNENNTNHNCLACNFAETVISLKIIAQSLVHIQEHDSITAKQTYIIWMYLLFERMEEIFKLISLPMEYKTTRFPTGRLIKNWANFLKHPKAFLLTHHASYEDVDIDNSAIKINDEFILKYYNGDKHNASLYQTISNNTNIRVIMPDINKLTIGLGGELKLLKNIISENPIYQSVLRDKTVLENYFSDDSLEQS
jgi:hypothetical protein